MHCFVALAIKCSMLKGMCVGGGGGRAHEIIRQTYSPLQSIWLSDYQVTAQMGSGRLGEWWSWLCHQCWLQSESTMAVALPTGYLRSWIWQTFLSHPKLQPLERYSQLLYYYKMPPCPMWQQTPMRDKRNQYCETVEKHFVGFVLL